MKLQLSKLGSRNILGIVVPVIITAIIRFFAYPHGYTFDSDATRDAIISLEGARHPYFPLAGAFSSTGPFTFGPWYYFSLMAIEFVLRLPFAPWLLITCTSLITVVVMYDAGRLILSKRFGYLLATFAALAPSEVIASDNLSNLSPVPLFAALTLWSSTRILTAKKPSQWWYLALGIFLGLGINAHYQMTGLLFLPILVWWFSSTRTWKTAVIIFAGLFITFIPLLIFNLMHNWHTIRGIVEMYDSHKNIYVANSWKLYLIHFWPSLIQFILGTPLLLSVVLLIMLPVVLCIDTVRKVIPRTIGIVAVVLLINFIELRYYWGERSFVYHYFLVPLILLLVAYIIYRLSFLVRYGIILSAFMALPILISMLIFDYNRDKSFITSPDPTPNIVKMIKAQYPNRPITIYKCTMDTTALAYSVAYLLQFQQLPNTGTPVKLAVGGKGVCKYPKNITSGTFATDMSIASSGQLRQASWSAVTTNELFEKTAKWY